MNIKPPSSGKLRIKLVAPAAAGVLFAYWVASFQFREQRVSQVKIGMSLVEVSVLLGEGRPIGAFESELTRCPPERDAVIFDGNASVILNGLWEDYVKVGAVNGLVCDVSRLGL